MVLYGAFSTSLDALSSNRTYFEVKKNQIKFNQEDNIHEVTHQSDCNDDMNNFTINYLDNDILNPE